MSENDKTFRETAAEGMDALVDVVDAVSQFGDLGPRLISALVMLVVGGMAIGLGGPVFVIFAAVVVGLMIWELARICGAHWALAAPTAIYAGFVMVGLDQKPLGEFLLFALPIALALALGCKRLRGVAVLFAAAILLAGTEMAALRWLPLGLAALLWLLAVVIISDMAGYFAGRLLGGPKFWPAISPKKTRSGTVAGWLGAAALGLGFYLAGYGDAALIFISPLIAFAGQMGDIAESWLKRRAGVKDSSRMIPGHGGVMDRFDAVVGASLAVLALHYAAPQLFLAAFGG